MRLIFPSVIQRPTYNQLMYYLYVTNTFGFRWLNSGHNCWINSPISFKSCGTSVSECQFLNFNDSHFMLNWGILMSLCKSNQQPAASSNAVGIWRQTLTVNTLTWVCAKTWCLHWCQLALHCGLVFLCTWAVKCWTSAVVDVGVCVADANQTTGAFAQIGNPKIQTEAEGRSST